MSDSMRADFVILLDVSQGLKPRSSLHAELEDLAVAEGSGLVAN